MERGGAHTNDDSKTEVDERTPSLTPARVPSRNKMIRMPSQANMNGKKSVNVLDLPWTPPDLQKAKLYADYVQPR